MNVVLDPRDLLQKARDHVQKAGPRCVICLKTGAIDQFETEEHIIPEGLGNKDWKLPEGMLCNDCQARMSAFELALLRKTELALIRPLYVQKGKKGKPPKAQIPSVKVEVLDDGSVLTVLPDIDEVSRVEKTPGGMVISIDVSEDSIVGASMALHKMAYEFWCLRYPDQVGVNEVEPLRLSLASNDRELYRPYAYCSVPGLTANTWLRFGTLNGLRVWRARFFSLEYILALTGDLTSCQADLESAGYTFVDLSPSGQQGKKPVHHAEIDADQVIMAEHHGPSGAKRTILA